MHATQEVGPTTEGTNIEGRRRFCILLFHVENNQYDPTDTIKNI